MANVTVRISNDNAALGQDATDDDLLRYAYNLETLLGAQFPGHTFDIVPALVQRSECNVTEVAEFVSDFERADGWMGLLEMPRVDLFQGAQSGQISAEGGGTDPALWYYEPNSYDGDVLWSSGYPTALAALDAALAADWSEQL